MKPSKFACVFPGQGSQHIGMAAEFMAESATKMLFEEADDTLGFHLTKLMREGDETALTKTENTQPALFVASAAAANYFAHQTGKPLSETFLYAAGHSVGEYAALYAAGVFSFKDGLKLVRSRGFSMASAVPAGAGGMAAVLGLFLPEMTEISREHGIFVANDNAEGQVVISGDLPAVEAAAEAAKAAGARRAIMLNVSAPFHCPLMAPAAEKMADEIAAASFKTPEFSVILNTTAQPASSVAQIQAELPKQIVQPVRWRESMQFLAQNNVENVVELGAGKVLSALAKRCDKRLNGIPLNTPKAVDEFLERLENE